MLKKYQIPIILIIVTCLILVLIMISKQNQSFEQFIGRSRINIVQELANKLGYRLEKDSIVKDFIEYSDDFAKVAAYIKNYGKTSEEIIFVERLNDTYVVKLVSLRGQSKEVQIADNEVNNSIDLIFCELHYRYISEDGGNEIYFVLEDIGIGFEHGVAFSKNGGELNGWGIRLTTTESIKDDWYYYEAK